MKIVRVLHVFCLAIALIMSSIGAVQKPNYVISELGISDDVLKIAQLELDNVLVETEKIKSVAALAIAEINEQRNSGLITTVVAAKRVARQKKIINDAESNLKVLAKKIAGIVIDNDKQADFLTKYLAPFQAGYFATEEEKEFARQYIAELEKSKTVETDSLMIKQLNDAIREQKIITGEEWSFQRKSLWTMVGLIGTLGFGWVACKYIIAQPSEAQLKKEHDALQQKQEQKQKQEQQQQELRREQELKKTQEKLDRERQKNENLQKKLERYQQEATDLRAEANDFRNALDPVKVEEVRRDLDAKINQLHELNIEMQLSEEQQKALTELQSALEKQNTQLVEFQQNEIKREQELAEIDKRFADYREYCSARSKDSLFDKNMFDALNKLSVDEAREYAIGGVSHTKLFNQVVKVTEQELMQLRRAKQISYAQEKGSELIKTGSDAVKKVVNLVMKPAEK